MSDVLIISAESSAAQRLREALERDGYSVAMAPSMTAALAELYLCPGTLRVILGPEPDGRTAADMLLLAAADPGPLGRHVYTTFEVDLSEIAASTP